MSPRHLIHQSWRARRKEKLIAEGEPRGNSGDTERQREGKESAREREGYPTALKLNGELALVPLQRPGEGETYFSQLTPVKVRVTGHSYI